MYSFGRFSSSQRKTSFKGMLRLSKAGREFSMLEALKMSCKAWKMFSVLLRSEREEMFSLVRVLSWVRSWRSVRAPLKSPSAILAREFKADSSKVMFSFWQICLRWLAIVGYLRRLNSIISEAFLKRESFLSKGSLAVRMIG